MENLKLHLVSLHNIDKDTEKATPRDIELSDASDYILNLSDRMISSKNVREYKVLTNTKEVISQILELCIAFNGLQLTAATLEKNTKVENPYRLVHNTIANRLLNEQISAQRKYKQITNIKKGSLIQSLLELDSKYLYIIALVEHDKFIDDNDLKYKSGMPEKSNITLKSARLHISKLGEVEKIYLSDSSPKISEYWSDGFLELTPAKDDINNTKFAYNSIKSILRNTLSKKYQSDYSEMKNALNVYFTHNEKYSHDELVEFLIDSYVPINKELNLSLLKSKLESANLKETYDNVFHIDNTEIKSQLTNIKYTINDNIELKMKKPPESLKQIIYSDKLVTGEKILIINDIDEKTFNTFNFKKND